MNRILIILFLVVSTNLLAQSNLVTISLKVNNAQSDTFYLADKHRREIGLLVLNPNKKSYLKITIQPGYFALYNSNKEIELYLMPNSDLQIELDETTFEASYSGKLKNENEYLMDKTKTKKLTNKIISMRSIKTMDEKVFLHKNDSVSIVFKNLLKNTTSLNTTFRKLENRLIEDFYTDALGAYKSRGYYFRDSTLKVSENYPKVVVTEIDIYDEDYYQHLGFVATAQHQIQKQVPQEFQNSKTKSIKALELVKNTIKNQNIINDLAFKIVADNLKHEEIREDLYKLFLKTCTNKEYAKDITELYNEFSKLKSGEKSPEFSFKDDNDKLYSLFDFKGKHLYIYLWTTWCTPCVKKLEDFNKVRKQLKNNDVEMITICIGSDKEKCRKIESYRKLEGIKLHCADKNNDFFRKYQISENSNSVILIDKDGLIAETTYLDPSEKKLIDALNGLK
jgi:peroxiredoxin